MSPDDGPCGVPWAMNLILVFLKPNEPPAANAHTEERENAPENCPGQERTTTVSCEGDK